jgi:hypothetical protein
LLGGIHEPDRQHRSHAHHVAEIVGARIFGVGIDVDGIVARRRHEHDSLVPLRRDGVAQRLRLGVAAPRIVGRHDIHAPIPERGHVVEAGDRVRGGTVARLREELAGQQLDVPRDARDAEPVVPHRADDAGDVGAVALVVHGIRIAIGRVDSMAVVDVAVAVVIDSVGGALGRIAPDVGREVFVVVIDAGIDDGHDDAGGAAADVPAFRRVDVVIGRAPGLSGVVQGPLLGKERVVRRGVLVKDVIGFGVLHFRHGAQCFEGRLQVGILGQPQPTQPRQRLE